MKKKILSLITVLICTVLCSCASTESSVNDLKGSITGNTYNIEFYSNTGDLTMFASGTNIDLSENIVREYTYNGETGWGYTKTLSSVITITIDGHEIESCGDTVIFSEDGLEPDVNFSIDTITSEAGGFEDYVFIAKSVNAYENYFGKSRIVVIKSQLGDPIVAYSGNDVYWEVCEDIPKTTKLYIDGKALYIHRANFQIIDKELID